MNSFHYQNPMYVSALADFLILFHVWGLIILVNRKYLKDMKDDTRYRSPGTAPSLINDVMTTRTKAAMIVGTLGPLSNWFFTLDYYLPESFYQLLLPYYQYQLTFFRFYFPFTTLIVPLMRYVFIVHNRRVREFGKEKLKKLIYYCSIWVPMMMTVLHAFTIPVPRQTFDITLETSYKFLEKSYNITCGDAMGVKDDCAPILSFVHQHISKDVTKIVGIGVKIFYAIVCSRIVAGILYWKTFQTIRE